MFPINLSFLVTAIVFGRIADAIFQLEWVFRNKDNNNSPKWVRLVTLTLHSLTYATLTYIFVILYHSYDFPVWIWIILALSHFIIDSRIPIDWIMKLKGYDVVHLRRNRIMDNQYWVTQHNVDQRLHEAVILVLAILV